MKTNKNNTVVVDERQKQIRKTAGVIAGAFLLVCFIGQGIYNIATTGDIGWEIWAIIGYTLIFSISCNVLGDIEEPRSISGRPLPTGSSKADRLARIKDYVFDSVLFALACAVMDVILIGFGAEDITDLEIIKLLFPSFNKTGIVILTCIFAFVTMFIISFIFDYLIGEKYKIAKYNKMIAELDED